MHKIFQLLASKVYLSPSGNLYTVPDEWSVYVGCREDDKVEENSGHFIKGTWKFLKVMTDSCSGLEGIPVLKYSLSAIITKNKGLQFNGHILCVLVRPKSESWFKNRFTFFQVYLKTQLKRLYVQLMCFYHCSCSSCSHQQQTHLSLRNVITYKMGTKSTVLVLCKNAF